MKKSVGMSARWEKSETRPNYLQFQSLKFRRAMFLNNTRFLILWHLNCEMFSRERLGWRAREKTLGETKEVFSLSEVVGKMQAT